MQIIIIIVIMSDLSAHEFRDALDLFKILESLVSVTTPLRRMREYHYHLTRPRLLERWSCENYKQAGDKNRHK